MRVRMMIVGVVLVTAFGIVTFAADSVPTDIEQPGTQPGEVGNLESPDKCDNCHGGYNTAVEPAHNWRGSMMANAGRDPIFWATLAIAEQDFDGVGDLCIRCHSTSGWMAGRSTPTDGSGLAAADSDGVDCDFCHKMTNPDGSEHSGEQFAPFVANDGSSPATGYYGSGMASLHGSSDKLGPYDDPAARHQFKQSQFHRSVNFCGTCHDVSNAVVGNLAHNNGAQPTADAVVANGQLGGPVDGKVAFNNFPHRYGVVERTFSEYKAGLAPQTRVRDYATLPTELQAGAYKAVYQSATAGGGTGDYADGTPRYFSCQACHMRPVTGAGCNKKGAPVRSDLPLHDMTGGNYWMPDAIQYLDAQGKLRLGGGLTTIQVAALNDSKLRAKRQLNEAVSLAVSGNTITVVNLTGHKLITGYPEGRRMWLNVKWRDADGELLREDGEYGEIWVEIGGVQTQVRTLLDLQGINTKIYEAHYGVTQRWAAQLVALSPTYRAIPVSYDRVTGIPELLLGDLAAADPGTSHDTFHFALNNTVLKDNRIPPYGMSYEEARKRNALPVPTAQYGGAPGGTYDHRDVLTLSPPDAAIYAEIRMLYQPTSWEYIQFLHLANDRLNMFLANEGDYILEAWLNTGMAEPHIMATASWGTPPTPIDPTVHVDGLTTWLAGKRGAETQTDTFSPRDTVIIKAVVVDESGAPVSGAQVFADVFSPSGGSETSLQGTTDAAGSAVLKWRTDRRQAIGLYTGKVTEIIKSGYVFDAGVGVPSVAFTVQ